MFVVFIKYPFDEFSTNMPAHEYWFWLGFSVQLSIITCNQSNYSTIF